MITYANWLLNDQAYRYKFVPPCAKEKSWYTNIELAGHASRA